MMEPNSQRFEAAFRTITAIIARMEARKQQEAVPDSEEEVRAA